MATETSNPPDGGTESGGSASALDRLTRLVMADEEEALPPEDADTEEEAAESEAEDEAEEGGWSPDDDTEEGAEEEPQPRTKAALPDDADVDLGNGQTVKMGELRAGYMKGADYTQKTQQLQAERAQLKQSSERYQQFEQQLAQNAQILDQMVKAVLPQKPDPNLIDTDLFAYNRQQVEYQQAMEFYGQLRGLQETQARRLKEAQAAQADVERKRLVEAIPDLKSPEKAKAFTEAFNDAVTSYGFKPEEVANWFDHRVYLMAQDAIKYRNIMKGQKSAKEEAAKVKAKGVPPVLKPGAKNVQAPSKAARQYEQQKAELRKTGSSQAARSLITQLVMKGGL